MICKNYRKDIFCSAYSEDGELFQLAIKLKNAPGSVAEIANILCSKHVNFLHGFHTVCPGREEAVWGLFIDLKESNTKIENLVKEIEGLESTIEVKFSRPIIDGLIVDNLHFPMMVMGERSIVMRIDTFAESFNRLYEKFGSGAYFILYEMGRAAGKRRIKKINEKYCLDKITALKVILAERAAKGWGISEIESFNEEKKESTITIRELFECMPFQGRSKRSKSHFFRGYLAGVLSQLFGNPTLVIEAECVAKGDPNCRFIGRPQSEIK